MTQQDIWARNIAILIGATVTIASVFGFWVGYKIGQTPAPPPVIINLPPQSK